MKYIIILILLASCSTQTISEYCNNQKDCIIAKELERNQLIEDVKKRRDSRQICTKTSNGVNCN